MNKKEFRLLIENWRRLIIEDEDKMSNMASPNMTLLEEFEKWSEYDVFNDQGALGNCSFYAWEFGRFCKEKGKNPKIIFMWNDINLKWKKEGDPSSEDHVVTCVDGVIYDFIRGLFSKDQKTLTREMRKNPHCMNFNESLFEDSGYYGEKGYHCHYVEDNPGFDNEGESEDSVRFTSYKADKVKNGHAPWPPQVGIFKPSKKRWIVF